MLKEKNIINEYDWFILFDKIKTNKDNLYDIDNLINVKGKIIIGCLPHQYRPKLFFKENIISEYSWFLNFKNIYYYINDTKYNNGLLKRELSSYNRKAELNINEFLIIAPIQYRYLIQNDFFTNYIPRNICHFYFDSDIEGFYCDKSENFTIDNLKLFPKLYFEHSKFNTFELNYKDLFVEKDNKYYFLIVIENGDSDDWLLGYAFLKKYQFAFNQDSKSIFFYNQEFSDVEENDKNNNKEKKNILMWIFIVISWIVFIGLGILFGIFIYKKFSKKKRANELNDDYDYIQENDDKENNKNIN